VKKLAFTLLILIMLSLVSGCSSDSVKMKMLNSSYDLNAVYAADEDNVWAVGSKGQILFFDGDEWVDQNSGTAATLNSVSGFDRNHVWAVGDLGTLLFYDGSEWRRQDAPALSKLSKLNDVEAVDSRNVWAVGEKTILFFNGSRWTETEAEWNLNGVTAADAENVWVAGDGGILYYDGSWHEQLKSETPINDVATVDRGHAWAVSCEREDKQIVISVFLRYDGSWNVVEKFPFASLTRLFVLDADHAWAVGGEEDAVYDGTGWKRQNIASYNYGLQIHGVYALSPDSVWAVGQDLGGKLIPVPLIMTYDGSSWDKQVPRW
jgi:hypothetical protein